MVVFSERMLPEVRDVFWGVLARGETVNDASKEVGTYLEKGGRWIAACGGIRPRRGRHLKGRCLTFAEREEIVLLRASGESMRAVARRLGRSASTISRELRHADSLGEYRPSRAHALAWQRRLAPDQQPPPRDTTRVLIASKQAREPSDQRLQHILSLIRDLPHFDELVLTAQQKSRRSRSRS